MKKHCGLLVTVFFLVAIMSQAVCATELEDQYQQSVSDYFNTPIEEVLIASASGIENDELAVVFYLAHQAKVKSSEVTSLREDGNSWADVSALLSVKPGAFYTIIAKPINSKSYSTALAKFKNTQHSKWNQIEFSDEEIVNLVNLRFLYKHHDYSVYEIIAMRDYGKDFAKVNEQVQIARLEIAKKQEILAIQRAEQEKSLMAR